MRLLDIFTFDLSDHEQATDSPPYAAMPHCWEAITLSDLHSLRGRQLDKQSQTAGCKIILQACFAARTFGVKKLFVDALCVDRSSTAEVSEALNSMFQIYRNAQITLVHLGDLNTKQAQFDTPERRIEQSRWGTRVWVLQEVVASKNLQFYDDQWTPIATKTSLLPFLSSFLRIDRAVLENSECLPDFSVGRRMSWAARLSANRPEDIAYSLLGIFEVNMTIMYGEGRRAFYRLQEEILKDTDDASCFAWLSAGDQLYRGIFANSPVEFIHFEIPSKAVSLRIRGSIQTSSAGILIEDSFGMSDLGREIVLCFSGQSDQADGKVSLGISLKLWNNRYVRSSPHKMLNLGNLPVGRSRRICISRDVAPRTSGIIATQLSPMLRASNGRDQSMESVSRAKADTASSLSPQSVSTVRQIDSKELIEPGKYARTGNEKIGLPRMAKELSNSPGTMVPLSPLLHLQAEEQNELRQSRSETISESEQHGRERCSNRSMMDERKSSDSSVLEEQLSEYSSSSEEIPILGHDIFTLKFTNQLVENGLIRFSQWLNAMLTGKISDRKRPLSPPTRKRVKKESFDDYSEVEYMTDPEDAEAVLVETCNVKANLFACPFQLQIPQKYSTCLKEGGFSTLGGLIRHLEAGHLLPHYCPVCRQIFSTAGACDKHIIERTCSPVIAPEMEGVTDYQIRQLSQPFYALQSKEVQWSAVWSTVFSATERPLMPYHSSSIESFIRLLRDFWSKNGKSVIVDLMECEDMQSENFDGSTQELIVYQKKALDQMVGVLLSLPLQGVDGKQENNTYKELLGGLYGILSRDHQVRPTSPSSRTIIPTVPPSQLARSLPERPTSLVSRLWSWPAS